MDAVAQVVSRLRRRDPATIGATIATVAALMVVLKWSSEGKAKAKAAYVTELAEVENNEYDVIVVGGGTAGCVLASRLSEDPSIKVLLLEAGVSAAKIPFAQIPSAYSRFWLGPHEWKMYTEPQQHASSRKVYWPRGKALGGCSNMNAMMFHYGAPSDYDEWAALQKGQAGANDWSYKEIHRYFNKFEKFNPSHEFPEVDATLRGAQGLVDIGYNGYFGPYTKDFLKACLNAGIAHSHDVNTHKGTLGVTRIMTYIDPKGKRVTSERAYLTPEVLARPNLKVATGAHVMRIVFDTTQATPRATGVEFKDKNGTKFVARAREEVVLAAGAVHTPHILMHSGVGPADHLTSHGIPVVADLPGVGSGLKDHTVIDVAYMDKPKETLNYLRPSGFVKTLKFIKALVQWQTNGTGPLSTNVSEGVGFLRTDDPQLFPPAKYAKDSQPEDTTTGEAAPDIEIFVSSVAYIEHGMKMPPNPTGYTFGMHAVCLRPKSTGTIRLRSNNPEDLPVIDPHYLEDPNDIKTLVRGLRFLDTVAHTAPLAARIDPAGDTHADLQHDLSKKSDEDLAQYVRDHVQTLYHPCCTARMAPEEDGGVVDTALRLWGIPNLRVADASVFPSIVAGHTTAPVYAIAEKASDLIKKDVGQGSRKL